MADSGREGTPGVPAGGALCIREVDRGELAVRSGGNASGTACPANPGGSVRVLSLLCPFKLIYRMRTLLFTLALATGMSAMAQQGHTEKTPAEKAERRTERMVQDLGLDATQQEKVASINQAYAKAMYDLRSVREEDRQGRTDHLKSSRDNAYQSVLTADQYAKLLQLREMRKADKDGGMDE